MISTSFSSYDDPEAEAHRDESKCTVSTFLIRDLFCAVEELLLEGISELLGEIFTQNEAWITILCSFSQL